MEVVVERNDLKLIRDMDLVDNEDKQEEAAGRNSEAVRGDEKATVAVAGRNGRSVSKIERRSNKSYQF